MGVLRYKIWYELWANKARTLQVVLIIGIGAFAIGLIIATRNIVSERLGKAWRASSPAMIWLKTSVPVDDETIAVLKRIDSVEDVEGFAIVNVEWRLRDEDEWSPARLIVRDDYEDQRYNRLTLLGGEWPRRDTFAVGQGGDAFSIPERGQLQIRANDREHVVQFDGVIADAAFQPKGDVAILYGTRDQMYDLVGSRDFDRIMAGAPVYDEATLKELATQIQRKLEKQGINSSGDPPKEGPSSGKRITDPDRHFSQDILDGVFFILGTIAVFALILGLFLVYNTISAVINQQISQIGIMKAVGASTGQILGHYLMAVLIYGLLASVIAILLGIVGSRLLSDYAIRSFYVEPGAFRPSLPAIGVQIAIALLAPLLAALVPIFSGARTTVRDAISTYGLSAEVGLLERLLAKVKRISRTWLLTISNTFRHKGRVFLTQITLVLSGLIFLTVVSVYDSTVYTFSDVLFSIARFNVDLQFEEPERISRVEALTLSHPDVEAVEMWGFSSGKLRPADQPETEDDAAVVFVGVPLPTTLYGPQIRAGRWLIPEDDHAVVLNQILAAEIGVGVGDWVTFDQGAAGEMDWRVVGLSFDPLITNSAHVPRQALLRELHSVGKANTIWIRTTRTDAAGEAAIAADLRRFYEENHLQLSIRPPFKADTASEVTRQIVNEFGVLFVLLAVMAIIIGLVGSIALNGILSLNVLERRREIGMMRAIGARSPTIAGLFVGEGLLLGWLSWLIALPFSLPAGWLMTRALGEMLNMGLIYHYAPTGALYWLGVITVLSVVASWLPARQAMRVSVRESLAYDSI
jgi:putative ABC transport system permease protein